MGNKRETSLMGSTSPKRAPRNPEIPVLMVTPTGKDSEVACDILDKFGFDCIICVDLKELCINVQEEAGALLIAEEALSYEDVPTLAKWLEQQPPWSDIPVIVLTTGGALRK